MNSQINLENKIKDIKNESAKEKVKKETKEVITNGNINEEENINKSGNINRNINQYINEHNSIKINNSFIRMEKSLFYNKENIQHRYDNDKDNDDNGRDNNDEKVHTIMKEIKFENGQNCKYINQDIIKNNKYISKNIKLKEKYFGITTRKQWEDRDKSYVSSNTCKKQMNFNVLNSIEESNKFTFNEKEKKKKMKKEIINEQENINKTQNEAKKKDKGNEENHFHYGNLKNVVHQLDSKELVKQSCCNCDNNMHHKICNQLEHDDNKLEKETKTLKTTKEEKINKIIDNTECFNKFDNTNQQEGNVNKKSIISTKSFINFFKKKKKKPFHLFSDKKDRHIEDTIYIEENDDGNNYYYENSSKRTFKNIGNIKTSFAYAKLDSEDSSNSTNPQKCQWANKKLNLFSTMNKKLIGKGKLKNYNYQNNIMNVNTLKKRNASKNSGEEINMSNVEKLSVEPSYWKTQIFPDINNKEKSESIKWNIINRLMPFQIKNDFWKLTIGNKLNITKHTVDTLIENTKIAQKYVYLNNDQYRNFVIRNFRSLSNIHNAKQTDDVNNSDPDTKEQENILKIEQIEMIVTWEEHKSNNLCENVENVNIIDNQMDIVQNTFDTKKKDMKQIKKKIEEKEQQQQQKGEEREEKDKDMNNEKEKEKDIDIEKENEKDIDKGEEKEKEKDKDMNNEKEKEKDKDMNNEKENEKEKEKEKDKDMNNEKEKEKDKDMNNEKENEKDKDKDMNNEKEKEKDIDIDEKENEKDIDKGEEKEKDKNMNKEKGKEKKNKKKLDTEEEKGEDKLKACVKLFQTFPIAKFFYQILIDVDRTIYIININKEYFKKHKLSDFSFLFEINMTKLKQNLSILLQMFVLFNPEMGYVQGMSYIAVVFLLYCDLESAFIHFSNFMERKDINDIYAFNNIEINFYAYAFKKILLKNDISIFKEIIKNYSIDNVFVQWIFTLFSICLPFNLFIRLFDIYTFYENVIFNTVVCIFLYLDKYHRLLGVDEILQKLPLFAFNSEINEMEFWKIFKTVKIKESQIKYYRKKYFKKYSDKKLKVKPHGNKI